MTNGIRKRIQSTLQLLEKRVNTCDTKVADSSLEIGRQYDRRKTSRT